MLFTNHYLTIDNPTKMVNPNHLINHHPNQPNHGTRLDALRCAQVGTLLGMPLGPLWSQAGAVSQAAVPWVETVEVGSIHG